MGSVAPLAEFIKGLPKAELHLHIEGTLEPELYFELAKRNGIDPGWASVEALRAAYNFSNLQSFLDLYFAGCSVLRTEQDFYDLAWAYLSRAAREGVKHAEVMFDPQTHLKNGVPFSTFVPGLLRALAHGESQLGVTSSLLMCFLRERGADDALQVLRAAAPYKEHISAVGLDSTEVPYPPSIYEKVFEEARATGYLTICHAGEEGPPSYVWEALRCLHVSRIDHGVRSMEDPELLELLKEKQIPLTVCPMSNLKLKVYAGKLEQELRRLLSLGLCITLNSDDPAYFGGYVNANYEYIAETCELNVDQVVALARASVGASFTDDARKAELNKQIDAHVASFLHTVPA